jgi:hypothetical protein
MEGMPRRRVKHSSSEVLAATSAVFSGRKLATRTEPATVHFSGNAVSQPLSETAHSPIADYPPGKHAGRKAGLRGLLGFEYLKPSQCAESG